MATCSSVSLRRKACQSPDFSIGSILTLDRLARKSSVFQLLYWRETMPTHQRQNKSYFHTTEQKMAIFPFFFQPFGSFNNSRTASLFLNSSLKLLNGCGVGHQEQLSVVLVTLTLSLFTSRWVPLQDEAEDDHRVSTTRQCA
ncbi:hypothetical protein CIHG_02418 [Coccidioides immitis H538.4]|uniref:Uncharacterized protein n=3 Tax=Coccidioides immitis TaxID=5501 RepID=A0A0J8R9C4_COCIT|nr:hypothetical protein CIRG_00580 [Coccidioides immitis RMSCC 2394]KMU81639.1 hypothetical protein CISG_09252 [Coccidioides immitis RMSCC 3703]KMU84632.1 hypothetical protein CIHG_02418 [Coccidioides immitis H538.4]